MSPVLEVRGLRTVVNRPGGQVPAVRDVSFAIEPGETVGLVGESGCGKSLTALSVMGLLPAAARVTVGWIGYEGRDIAALSQRELRAIRGAGIAMIYQDPAAALNPLMRVGAQIREGLAAHGVGDAAGRTIEALAEVGLPRPERIARAYPHQLSGGQRQRVMIAMALAPRPRVLIADEPTTALDATIQHQILTLVAALAGEHDLAVLWITHDLGVVARLARRVMVMYAGRIVEEAPVDEIFRAPRHPYTAGLIGSLPPRRGARRDPLPQIGGRPPDPGALRPGCPFEPRCPQRRDRCRSEEPPLDGDPDRPLAAGPGESRTPGESRKPAPAARAACWVPRDEWS